LDIIQRLRECIPSVFSREGKTDFHNLLGETSPAREFDQYFHSRLKSSPNARLDKFTHDLLVQYLNDNHSYHGEAVFVTMGNSIDKIRITPSVWSLDKVVSCGFWYRAAYPRQSTPSPNEPFAPHADSHVLVQTADSGLSPCSIQEIFAHKRGDPHTKKPIIEIFLLVRRYTELNQEDLKLDCWRQYTMGGGFLYYDAFATKSHIIKVDDIVAHFAKTPLTSEDIPGLSGQCIHVLPLNWVSINFFRVQYTQSILA
jgi:hypothetical protein